VHPDVVAALVLARKVKSVGSASSKWRFRPSFSTS
jgi:hypothetical protein